MLLRINMKFTQIIGLSLISALTRASTLDNNCVCNGDSNGDGLGVAVIDGTRMNPMQVSSNNTILQNLYALSLNRTESQNSTLSYLSLLLGLNTSCTASVAQMLNSTSPDTNYTFFAPSDEAFRAIPGFPDFGSNFCDNCGSSSHDIEGECPSGCSDSSLALNATSSQLLPCLPQILQYHLLNESLTFNSTTFGFLNRSSFNLTVLPTMLNSSCLVNLSNSTDESAMNNQVLVFNITESGDSEGRGDSESSEYSVKILHGINTPANVTVFDIQSSNGVIHVVDALLIPPANLTDTIKSTYQTEVETSGDNDQENGAVASSSMMMLPSFLNQTDLEMFSNMTGITVFLPDLNSINMTSSIVNGNGTVNTINGNNTISGNSTMTSFDIRNYIFPTLLYNNRTFQTIGNLTSRVFIQQNLTNLNGENVTILFGNNNQMLFNGSRVSESNILVKNGVIHLFDNSTNLTDVAGNIDSVESIENGETGNGNGNNENGAESNVPMAGLGRIFKRFA